MDALRRACKRHREVWPSAQRFSKEEEFRPELRLFTRGDGQSCGQSDAAAFSSQGCFCLPSQARLRSSNSRQPPPIVETAAVKLASVTTQAEFVGSVVAAQQVALTARVEGFLDKVNFTEGSFVQADSVAFVIEKDTYQAAVEGAQAQLAVGDCRRSRRRSQSEAAGPDPGPAEGTPEDQRRVAIDGRPGAGHPRQRRGAGRSGQGADFADAVAADDRAAQPVLHRRQVADRRTHRQGEHHGRQSRLAAERAAGDRGADRSDPRRLLDLRPRISRRGQGAEARQCGHRRGRRRLPARDSSCPTAPNTTSPARSPSSTTRSTRRPARSPSTPSSPIRSSSSFPASSCR